MLEVACTRKDSQLARVARGGCRIGVRARDLESDGRVALAVQHELVDAERDELARRGEGEHVGLAEQRSCRRVRGRRDGREPKVGNSGLGDDGARPNRGLRARRVLGQPVPRRRPQREVPTGAVPDRADPFEVERGVEGCEEIDPGRDVEERLRPPAAVSDAPVLEVPGGEPVCREIRAQPVHQRAVVGGPPVAAVHHHDDRMPPGAARERQLADLARVVAVAVVGAFDRARL